MGRITCECGHAMSDTCMPNSNMNFLITSGMAFDEPETLSDDKVLCNLTELWECPECHGLSRFDNSAYRTCFYKRIDDEKASELNK